MRIWRLTPARHAGTALSGAGAKLYGGRWNNAGTPVVYLSEHLSLCALEILVHANPTDLPDHVAIPVDVPEDAFEAMDAPWTVSPLWRDVATPTALRAFGDGWAKEERSLLLRVPSVVVPEEHNYLLNPLHAGFAKARVGKPVPFTFDPRLGTK